MVEDEPQTAPYWPYGAGKRAAAQQHAPVADRAGRPVAGHYGALPARLKELCDGHHKAALHLFVPALAQHEARAARMMMALADALESFWSDADIELDIYAAPGESALIQTLVLKTPRLTARVTEGAWSQSERKALATASPCDLVFQMDFGSFPVRPVGSLPLLAGAIRQIENITKGKVRAAEASVAAVAGPVRVLLRGDDALSAALASLLSCGSLFAKAGPAPRLALYGTTSLAECGEHAGTGWARQPQGDDHAPLFMTVADWAQGDIEPVIGLVYAALHR